MYVSNIHLTLHDALEGAKRGRKYVIPSSSSFMVEAGIQWLLAHSVDGVRTAARVYYPSEGYVRFTLFTCPVYDETVADYKVERQFDRFWCKHCCQWRPFSMGCDDEMEEKHGPICDNCAVTHKGWLPPK